MLWISFCRAFSMLCRQTQGTRQVCNRGKHKAGCFGFLPRGLSGCFGYLSVGPSGCFAGKHKARDKFAVAARSHRSYG
jgi:hypothetical protein